MRFLVTVEKGLNLSFLINLIKAFEEGESKNKFINL